MIYLLFRAERTRPRPIWAFWQQRHEADVYAFIAADSVPEARKIATRDMDKRGWRIEDYRVERIVDESFRRDAAEVRVSIWAATREGANYRFYPPFEYAKSDEDAPDTRYLANEDVRLDPERVPPALRPLLRFADRWAIVDDAQRNRALAEASREDKRALARAVAPHFAAIESFAAQHAASVPVPDEVVALNLIAEAADLAALEPER